jgi:hypothetical protein
MTKANQINQDQRPTLNIQRSIRKTPGFLDFALGVER